MADPSKGQSIFKCDPGNGDRPMFTVGTIDDAVSAMDTGPTAIVKQSLATQYMPLVPPPSPVAPTGPAALGLHDSIYCLWVMDINGHSTYEYASGPAAPGSMPREDLDNVMQRCIQHYGGVMRIAYAFAAITPPLGTQGIYGAWWQKVNMGLWTSAGTPVQYAGGPTP